MAPEYETDVFGALISKLFWCGFLCKQEFLQISPKNGMSHGF